MPCRIDLEFLLKAIPHSSCLQKAESIFDGLSTDSRQDLKGKVFFALKGPHFDGQDFLQEAMDKGAIAFVVSDKNKVSKFLKNKRLTVIHVPDTLKALQKLAYLWNQRMKTKVVAITGSNGKTTTRYFAQTLFLSEKPFFSPKSHNNFVGVPLSLLQVNREGAFLIQEIGTNSPGEVAFLTSLCRPVISTVTMVGPSHLEGLGSEEAVAREKQQVYSHSASSALWIFNRDNFWTENMFQKSSRSQKLVLTFSSIKQNTDVCLNFVEEKAMSSLIQGRIGSVKGQSLVLFSGSPHLENLMCACCLALGAGIDPKTIWNQISQCRLPPGRQELLHIKDKNISIFFDGYNANPSSMNFFLDFIGRFSTPQQRLLALGDMKELGPASSHFHKQLATHSALLESRFIIFMGQHGLLLEEELKKQGFKGSFICSDIYNSKILSVLREELKPGDFLAVKASRSFRLERLVRDLTGKKIF